MGPPTMPHNCKCNSGINRSMIIPLLDGAVVGGRGRCQDVFGSKSLYGCRGTFPQGVNHLDDDGGGGRIDHWGRSLASSIQQSLNLKSGAALINYSFVTNLLQKLSHLTIIELTMWLAGWQLTPRRADVTVTKIAGYVHVRILMNR